MKCSILWCRHDLRLEDNSALAGAIARGGPIVPVFIWAPQEEGMWAPGGATRWWLHHALADLEEQFASAGLKLVIRDARKTSSLEMLLMLARESNADVVYWNRRYEPSAVTRDGEVRRALEDDGIGAESHESSLLFAPEAIANKSGKPFQVFTPMWKHFQSLEIPEPAQVRIAAARAPATWPASEELDRLELLESINGHAGFGAHWGVPSRSAALDRLREFTRDKADLPPGIRDIPSQDGTTQLSPYLHFGQIGVRETWSILARAGNPRPALHTELMRQIVWREFAHYLLHHFPHTPQEPKRPEFALFPWEDNGSVLRRWQQGETGFPIVDAGLRQLLQTGWMHNRVRMIVASFLVKHLLQHWIEGARWFWDRLVDADLANNTMGWQWVAGCGADAAPYFRVFNPIAQGERFDPEGIYVTRWVPELQDIPVKFIHRPWELGELDLKAAIVTLEKNYPAPIVGHAEGRARALAAFAKLKSLRES